ncbi:MAG TPA: tetratricopeptide repeat protein, partial [Nannocystis exedens]|nr:tetratricopeptide repeat protein [Nannocystis exedens]
DTQALDLESLEFEIDEGEDVEAADELEVEIDFDDGPETPTMATPSTVAPVQAPSAPVIREGTPPPAPLPTSPGVGDSGMRRSGSGKRVGDSAMRKVPRVGDSAMRKAPPLGDSAMRKAPPLGDSAMRKAPRFGDSAMRKAPPLGPAEALRSGIPSAAPTRMSLQTPAAMPAGSTRPPRSETLRTGDAMPAPLVQLAAATGTEPFIEQARLLIRDWEGELGGKPDLFRAARLYYEIARLSEFPLRDLARAAIAYQKSLGLNAEHLPSLVGARRVLLAQRDYSKALPLFDAEVRLSADPNHKASLIYAKGRVLEDSMGKENDARAAYAAALDLCPGSVTILKALERIDHRTSNWRGLEQTYAKIASSVELDPRHRAAIVIRRAHLLEARTSDSAMAVELYESAVELDPRAAGAYAALKRLHHGKRRWRELIQVLIREARHTEDREVRAMAYYRIARLHSERLGNRDLAIESLERSVAEVPEDRLVLEELIDLYRAAGRFDAMAATLEHMVQGVEHSNERISLLHRLGALHEGPLDDESTAIRWYEESLALEPAYLPGLRALTKLYT